jgi:hypothetical protein
MGFPEPCWACDAPTESASESARDNRTYLTIGNAAPDRRLAPRRDGASLHMAEAVKPYVAAIARPHHQTAKKPRKGPPISG